MSDKYWTIRTLAERLQISPEKTRLLVMNEPGVMRIKSPSGRSMYRIPNEVAERIVRRYQNPVLAA